MNVAVMDCDGTEKEDEFQQMAIHQELLEGEGTNAAGILQRLPIWLAHTLTWRFPDVERDWIDDAATDAFLDYRRRPESYDAERGVPLKYYLLKRASHDVSDRLKSERRRKHREEVAANTFLEIVVPIGHSASHIEREQSLVVRFVQLAKVLKNSTDRDFVAVWMRDERCVTDFAKVLGIADQPLEFQCRAVTRTKGRLFKTLRRAVAKSKCRFAEAEN